MKVSYPPPYSYDDGVQCDGDSGYLPRIKIMTTSSALSAAKTGRWAAKFPQLCITQWYCTVLPMRPHVSSVRNVMRHQLCGIQGLASFAFCRSLRGELGGGTAFQACLGCQARHV